jgi:hypothetical protein
MGKDTVYFSLYQNIQACRSLYTVVIITTGTIIIKFYTDLPTVIVSDLTWGRNSPQDVKQEEK